MAGLAASDLSRLLEDLARIPRIPVPDRHHESLEPGQRVGRFVIQREIGRGGFGVVYAALDPELGRSVALKVLRPGIGVVQGESGGVRAEAEAVARLNHPAIVTIFEVGRDDEGAFLVFELLHGECLDARLRRGGMDVREAVRVALAVASALHEAHSAGVLHRDLKPANVFLCTDGAVKVLDFGIAQMFDRGVTPPSGTPGYMAPEQCSGGSEDARTDLYSLGVLLDNLLSACVRPVDALRMTRSVKALRALCESLTHLDPACRPGTARLVLERLATIQDRQRRGSWGWTLAASAAVVAAAATWAVAELWRPNEAASGETLSVAFAPTTNETGSPEFDHLSEMLRTSISDSPRFRVISSEQMDARLRDLGLNPQTADLPGFRRAAEQLGASAILVPEASVDGERITVTIAVRDVTTNEVLFKETAVAPTMNALVPALDGAVLSVRRQARERSSDLSATSRPLAQLTTPSLGAYHDYALAQRCIGGTIEALGRDELDRCGDHLRRALEKDPSFALAHREMAIVQSVSDRGSAEARRHLALALAASGRMSRRDEELARAWQDHLDQDDTSALKRYAALLSADPGDVQTVHAMGDLHFHAGRYAEALPYLARVAGLGVAFPFAFDHLVESFAMSGRYVELQRALDERGAPTSSQIPSVVRGETWLGRHDRAVNLARRAERQLPGSSGAFLLIQALVAAGRLDEAEALAVRIASREPTNRMAFVQRILIVARRGRAREAWRLVESPPQELENLTAADLALLKASIAAGDRRLPRLRAELKKLEAMAPEFVPVAALQLSVLGTLEDARVVQRMLPTGTVAAIEAAALVAWKRGQTTEAVSTLADLDRTAPRPNDALSPAFLLAEVAREADPAEAFAAAALFRRRVPIGPAGGWTHGRSLLASAEAAWRLGRRDDAMGFVEECSRTLVGADNDFALLAEVGRLRKAISSRERPGHQDHFGPH